MLHGNPTWSFHFRHLIHGLAGDFRCIAPDHIGMGLSAKPPDARYPYTLSQRVADLERLLEHLAAGERLTLVLHDWGGLIGMLYATRHAERVERLVLFNTAAFGLASGSPLPWQLAFCRGPLGPLAVRGLNLFCRTAVRACAARPLGAAVRAAYLAPYDSWRNRRAVLRFVQDIPLAPGDRAYPLLQEVESNLHRFRDLPALICWGLKDFVFDASFLERWRRVLPHAEVHRFEEAGHYVLEDAREAVVPLVRAFLARDRGHGC